MWKIIVYKNQQVAQIKFTGVYKVTHAEPI